MAEYLPVAHERQPPVPPGITTEPVEDKYWPAGQEVHAEAPVEAW